MAETCFACGKQAVASLSYTRRAYCKRHFLALLEKRVRKHLRTRKLINPRQSYALMDDGSVEAKVTRFLLERIFPKTLSVDTVQQRPNPSTPTIVPWCAEQEINQGFTPYIGAKPEKDAQGIRVLIPLLQEEIWALADLFSLGGTRGRISIHPLLESMQERFPETKFSLLKSFAFIDEHAVAH